MSFPRYPAYKDSGLDWLGEVPAHWEVKRLGQYFSERREKVSDRDYEPLSVTKNGVLPQLDTAAKTDDGDNRKLVLRGDFVINSRSDRKGSSGLSDRDGSVSLINTVVRPYEQMAGEFAHHLLRSVSFQEEYYRYGRGIVADLWSTNYSEMKNISLAIPPLAEQTQIALFLDRETAKIDALVAEQERLIELLKEKRQAVISHAVTKGLDPSVPTKDSGVEWLGKVPAHWDVRPLKHLARLTTGMTPPTDEYANYEDTGFPWIRPEDLDESGAITKSSKFLSEKGKAIAREIQSGASLICCIGTIGKVGIVDESVSTNQQITAAKFSGNDRYFYFVTCAARTELEITATGNVLKILNTERLGEVKYSVPPLDEQTAIAAFLDRETAKIDALVGEARTAVTLLQERRSALVSAAVTGQIDVRQQAS